ncbi:MAG: photosynthesis system assembly factor family protein, partial [Nevskia sp.]|nr:photosynthesis system assembly factor family protein [Nevskia sp.]
MRALALFLLALTSAAQAEGSRSKSNRFIDPLDVAALQLAGALQPEKQPLMAITAAGSRLVAVGFRGLIVLSDDAGKTWRQAEVPVQTDLLSACFVSPKNGWVSGHDGVVLQTVDGGTTWQRRLDNRLAKTAFPDFYRQKVDSGESGMQPFLDQVLQNTQNDSSLPYLSILFENEQLGYAVGAFGVIATTADGGASWTPASHRIDNPKQLNLNAVRLIAGNVYIAAEQGLIFRLDRTRDRFVAVQTGYQGSFFDIIGNADYLLAYGLRGTAYRSVDRGLTWSKVDTASGTALYGGAVLGDGTTAVLLSEAGEVLLSHDRGLSFKSSGLSTRSHVAGAFVAGSGEIISVGY